MLLLVFLLFSSVFGSGIFDKIETLKKELAEEYVRPDGLIREDLAAKLQGTIDSYRASHSVAVTDLPDSNGDSIEKFKELWEKLKQEQETKINDLKAEIEEQRTAKEAERAQKKKVFQQRWNEIKQKISGKVDEIKTKIKKEHAQKAAEVETRSLLPKDLTVVEKQQLVQELFTVFEAIANTTRIRKAEKKKERQEAIEQMKPAIHEFFTNLKTKFSAWKAAKEEEKAQKWEDVKVILSSLIQNAIKKKKEKDAAVKEFWDQIYAKIVWAGSSVTSGEPAPAEAAVKATFLDQLTGTSTWQNVTWILLAICVFLAVALLGTILYQNTRRLKYERLPGDDGAHPIYPKLELRQDF